MTKREILKLLLDSMDKVSTLQKAVDSILENVTMDDEQRLKFEGHKLSLENLRTDIWEQLQ